MLQYLTKKKNYELRPNQKNVKRINEQIQSSQDAVVSLTEAKHQQIIKTLADTDYLAEFVRNTAGIH